MECLILYVLPPQMTYRQSHLEEVVEGRMEGVHYNLVGVESPNHHHLRRRENNLNFNKLVLESEKFKFRPYC